MQIPPPGFWNTISFATRLWWNLGTLGHRRLSLLGYIKRELANRKRWIEDARKQP